MIERYSIGTYQGEKVLFLYLSYDYEFGVFEKKKFQNLREEIYQYIQKLKLDVNQKKVVLVSGGIIMAILTFSQPKLEANEFTYISGSNINWNTEFVLDETQPESKEEVEQQVQEKNKEIESVSETKEEHQQPGVVKENDTPIEEKPTESFSQETIPATPETIHFPITINRSGTMVTMELEDYVIGVVASEMPASFSSEALKAQSVLARTYALKRIQEGKSLTDTVETQVYQDNTQLRQVWGNQFDYYYQKVKEACESTKGQVLLYQGKYIDAVYHSTSNGKTEAARNVWGYEIPYLQSVDSSWDINTTFYADEQYKDMNTLIQLFGIADLKEGDIEILSRNESGRVSEVRVKNQTYQGVDLRSLLGLRSSDFDFSFENGNLVITTRGWGHGVGMSQYGANGMAKQGYTYSQILSHYYVGTNLGNI